MTVKRFILKFLDEFENYFAQILLAIFVLLLFIQVVLRMTFGHTLAWSEELSRFAFVWFVFLGASHGARVGAHSRVSVQFRFLPSKVRDYILAFADLLWVIFNSILVYKGIMNVIGMIEFPYSSPTLGWSMAYIYAIIPFCFFMMTIRIIQVNYLKFVKNVQIDQLA